MKRTFTRTAITITLAAAVGLASVPAHAGLFRDWEDSEIKQVKTKVETARANAVEIVNKARAGFNKITTDMRSLIDESVDDLQRELQDQIEGRQAFMGTDNDCGPGSECDTFRWRMVDLFQGIENASNTAFAITPADARLDLKRTRELIEVVPGRALYPLYRAMTTAAGGAGNGLIDAIQQFADDLQVIHETLQAGEDYDAQLMAAGGSTSNLSGSCQFVLADPTRIERAVTGVAVTAGAMKLLGKGLIALGETGFDEKDAGVHGYVHVTLKNNRKKKFGSFLDGLSDFGLAFSSYASNKLRYCTVLQTREEIMAVFQDTDGSEDDMLSKIRSDLEQVMLNQQVILNRLDNIGPPWGKANGHASRGAR